MMSATGAGAEGGRTWEEGVQVAQAPGHKRQGSGTGHQAVQAPSLQRGEGRGRGHPGSVGAHCRGSGGALGSGVCSVRALGEGCLSRELSFSTGS